MSNNIFSTAEAQDRTLSLLAVMILVLGAAMLASAGTHLVDEETAKILNWLGKAFGVMTIIFALLSMVPWMRSRGQSCGPEVEGFLSDVAKRSLNASWFFTLGVVFLVIGRLSVEASAAFYKDAMLGIMLTSYGVSFLLISWRSGVSGADKG